MPSFESIILAVPCILHDRLITVEPDGPLHRLSLPELIARLLAGPDDVLSFPNVTPVQRSYWYRFLVRCGAKALHSIGVDTRNAASMDPAALATQITQALSEASGGDDAWLLHQSDPKRPAFLQAPTIDGSLPESSYARNSMSLLTSAIGSKMHERKTDVDRVLDAEQAVYALIEYQTGVIFGGRGNYSSQLMGSASGMGSGSPFMGVRLGNGYRETYRHDVSVFLDRWEHIRNRFHVAGDIWALWTEHWDGVSSLPARELDPAFIPFARLIRLGKPTADGRFDTVWFKPTSCARVADHSEGGMLGDIFTPAVSHPKHPGGWKVRGTMRSGYDYHEIARLLFQIEAMPSDSVAALARSGNAAHKGARIVFEGTVFEQGKTDGFHYREVVLPSTNSFALLANPEPVQAAHKAMLGMARDAKSAIRGAARILLAGSPKPREGDGEKVEVPARALEAEIDRDYIPTLLAAAERHAQGDMGYLEDWGAALTVMTRSAFDREMHGLPTSGARRFEREILARTWLDYRLRVMRGEETGGSQTVDEFETSYEEVDA